jgi:hypothetical protein
LTNGATSSWGGGLSVESSYTNAHAHLFDCSIVSNSASSGAGIGIGNATSVDLTDSIVSANVAGIGGGICVAGSAGGIITSPGALTLTNSTVSGNTATGNIYVVGGGIAGGPGCSIAIANSVVSGNSSVAFSGGLGSSAGGGGIDSNSGTLTISSSTVSGNSSVGTFTQGGGIRSTYGIVAISNSLVSENASAGSSSGEGGGVFSFGSLTMTNSTVSRNSSTDPTRSGIFVFDAPSSYYYSDDLHIANTILWDNGLYPLALYGSPSGSVEHSLVEGGWAGTGNIDADPLFADPPGGDFRLLPGSPCIDAGDNLAVPQGLWVDLSGKRRFIDDPSTPDTGNPGHLLPIVDMGAHEFGLDPPRKVRDGRGVKVR